MDAEDGEAVDCALLDAVGRQTHCKKSQKNPFEQISLPNSHCSKVSRMPLPHAACTLDAVEDEKTLPEDAEEIEKELLEETVSIGLPVSVAEELEEKKELEADRLEEEELKENLLEEEEGAGAQTGDHGHPLLSNSHSLSISAYPNGQ